MKDLAERDKQPVGEGALVRFQKIGMGPGIGRNFRLVVMDDGRLYLARNTEGTSERDAVYNVPLPQEPATMLAGAVVADIRAKMDEVEFFDEGPYVARERVRDGSLSIVTARRHGREHEVWYLNVNNKLTDLLHGLGDAAENESSPADLLEEQLRLRSKLEER